MLLTGRLGTRGLRGSRWFGTFHGARRLGASGGLGRSSAAGVRWLGDVGRPGASRDVGRFAGAGRFGGAGRLGRAGRLGGAGPLGGAGRLSASWCMRRFGTPESE